MLPVIRVIETEGVVVGFVRAAIYPDQGGCRWLSDFGCITSDDNADEGC